MNIAIITGASSGLGREYARLLAAEEALDELWLIARRRDHLESLAQELSPVPCRIFSCDLTQETVFPAIQQQLAQSAGLEVRWLINAAGFGLIGISSDINLMDLSRMVDLNCRAAMSMTQLALPFMSAGSHILQICSCAAFQPIPYLAVYAATKSFLLSYSRALSAELRPQGIGVTAVCPYWIRDTEFISQAIRTDKTGLFHGFPFACTKHETALRSLRAARSHIEVCTPDLISFLHRILTSILPHSMLVHLSKIYRYFA